MARTQRATKASVEAQSPLLTGIDTLIGLLEAEAAGLASMGIAERSVARGVPVPGTPSGQLEDLDLFVQRLRQIHDWLRQDPRLLPVVDDAIGKQVRALEQRQTRQNLRLAAITTIGGAILGWLISVLGSPAALLHLFVR